MSKEIIIVKPGTISKADKTKLTKAGRIVIEHPFPGDVRIVEPSNEVMKEQMLYAAIEAISQQTLVDDHKMAAYRFVGKLASRLTPVLKPKTESK